MMKRKEPLDERIEKMKSMMSFFDTPENASIISLAMVHRGTFIDNNNSNLNDLSAQIFAVFSKTQKVCHDILKTAYDSSDIRLNETLSYGENVPIFKNTKEILFKDLENEFQEKSGKKGNYDIDHLLNTEFKAINLFNQLKYNTSFFFYFVDKYFGSIVQYFKDVNPKFVSVEAEPLVEMKNMFDSFYHLREPAQHLIRLFYNALIKSSIECNEKYEDELTNENSESMMFQNMFLEQVVNKIFENPKLFEHGDEYEYEDEEEEEEEKIAKKQPKKSQSDAKGKEKDKKSNSNKINRAEPEDYEEVDYYYDEDEVIEQKKGGSKSTIKTKNKDDTKKSKRK